MSEKISLSNIRNEIMGYRLKEIYNSGEKSMFDNELDREAMRKKIEELTGENVYKIIYCFTDKQGRVQEDEYGCEEYWSEDVWAKSQEEAERKFRAYFEAKKMAVDIADIIERR